MLLMARPLSRTVTSDHSTNAANVMIEFSLFNQNRSFVAGYNKHFYSPRSSLTAGYFIVR